MGKRSKKTIARIMAVIMAFMLLPFDTMGTAGIVMAEESGASIHTGGGFSTSKDAEEPASTETDVTFSESTESENSDTVLAEDVTDAEDEEDESSASANEVKAPEEVKETEVKKEKKEEEKTSADRQEDLTANTDGYTLSKTTEWTFTKKFFEDLGYTKNGTITADKPIAGITMLSSTAASNKMTETTPTLSLGTNVKIGLNLQNDTEAVEITIKVGSNSNAARYVRIGTGNKAEDVYQKNGGTLYFDSTTNEYTNANLYLKTDGTFSNKLEIESLGGENKIASIVLKEYKSSGPQKEKAPTPKANETEEKVQAGTSITLSCDAEKSVTIYYTTDGKDPKNNNDKKTYVNGIEIPSDMVGKEITIKAYAEGDEYSASDVATFTYTVIQGANQLASPTAEPGDPKEVTEVKSGDTVTLKSTDENAEIYYTLDETIQLTKDNGILFKNEKPIVISENTKIKAIAVADGKIDSSPVIFEYTIKKSTISVADDSTEIIKSVEKKGDVIFENQDSKEVYDVQLSAEKNTSFSSDAITGKVEEGGEALSYDLKLINVDEENDTVSIKEGTLKVKMPYSIATSKVGRKNEIIVLNGEKITEVRKDVDGILFSVKSVADPYTIIINPVPVEDDDEMAPKTYVLDAEELTLTDIDKDIDTNTPYGTEDYFTLMCTPDIGDKKGKKAAIAKIADVTTGSGANQVNCYTDLKWSDEILNAIGGGRTQCVRITGGSITTDNNQPVNCIKITTKLDATKFKEANVVVYFTPKGTTSRKITVKKDNGGQLGDTAGTSSTGVTRANVGKAEFKLTTAGTYYIGFDGDGGIIPYMEVTEVPKVPEIDMPTADPVSGTELNRKSTITLKAADANIYYTTNGVDPTGSSSDKKYTEPLAVADLPVNNNKITIKAIAIAKAGAGQGISKVATFEYEYDPDAVAVVVAEDSKEIIKSAEAVGNVSDVKIGNEPLKVTDIMVKAQELQETEVANDIKAKARELVSDADKSNIKYYNLSLLLNEAAEAETDTVTFTDADAALKLKMPYSIFKTDALGDVTEENEIYVLHNAEQIDAGKIRKETVTSQNAEDAGFLFEANSFSPYTVVVKPAAEKNLGTVKITDSAGYEEGVYAKWEAYSGAGGYKAYMATEKDGEFVRIDNELIREYQNYWRVDTVGLAAGDTYYLKVEAIKVNTEGDDKNVEVLADKVVGPLTVTNYDRSGFAFSSQSPLKSGSGAYKDNGELKDGAQVIYVTKDTAKTCKAKIHSNGTNKPAVEVTGLQSILDAKQKKGTEKDIIDIRIIGRVAKDDLDHISSKAEGLQIKGAAKYNEMNITIEGIGEDAVVHGFGFLIRNCGNVELRNFAIMAFMDDGVSLDTANCNIWVHDLDIFYGATGGDSDQAKGDGSVDVKGKSTYITIAYNHFWDSGKCSLCGMSDSEEFMVTYHHNWFDHSDSRHPRIRVGSIHVYNNYFDGNSKYGVGTTKGSSAFVEANYFRNCNYPMMSSKQGTDAMGDGTFSGEDGGMIKAYNNKIDGANRLIYANSNEGTLAANATSFDAYLALNRSDRVPNTFKTVSGGTTYNNFDTSYDLGVKESAVDSPDKVKDIVTQKAGRLNGGDFKRKPEYAISNNDESYAVDTTLKAAVVNYKSEVVFIGGIKGVSTDPGSSSGGSTGGGSGSSGGDGSGDNDIIISGGEIYEHNFTKDGFSSDGFFTINANKQSSPKTVNYVDPNGNPLTLTQAIKMESSTKISFTAAVSGTLIIVLVPESGKTGKTKVDGANHDPADGIIEVYFDTAGTHTIEKGDKADIYYIAYVEDTYDTNDVRDPIFNIPAGNLPIGTPFTLKCETEGAEIYYTTDDTNPTSASTKYTSPVTLNGNEGETVTVKAIAIKGEDESNIVSCTYTFVDPNKYVAEPTASEEEGTLEKGTHVTLSTITADAEIYFTYTTDETEPADPSKDNGTLYTGPIIISRTTIIKAIAVKGELKSEISRFKYTVSSGNQGGETTGAKTFEFNPQKIGFTLDETDNDKKLHKLPTEATKYGTDNYFTIGNKDGKAKISENILNMPEGNKSGITEYKIRYQFGGSAGNTDPKAIKFTTYGSATVYVGAYGSDDTRKLSLDAQSKALTTAPAEYVFSVEKGAHVIFAEKDYYILYIIVEDTDVPGAGEPSGGDDDVSVSKPVAAPPSGEYDKGTKVSLGAELGAKIYYTTDDSEPTTDSTLYTKEIVLEEDVTIKAIAELDGETSETAAFEYKVKQNVPPTENKVSEPESNYTSGTKVKKGTQIELTCDTEAAQIYYTLDGTAPNESSTRILYEAPIVINADTTIKAVAVKAGYLDSDVITLEYTVFEKDDVEQVAQPKANIASGTKVKKGTPIELTSDTKDAQIYYTLDGTAPSEKSTLYTAPIIINENTTIKAIATKTDCMNSAIATFGYTVTDDDITVPEGVGLRVVLKYPKETYTYTGSAITPDIVVWNNSDRLVEGTDYTVKYSNNINASAGVKENKKPSITVTGKGNLTGNASTTFEIEKKRLDDGIKGAGIVEVGGIVNDTELGTVMLAVENTKLSPTLYYGGVKLTNKDVGISKTDKCGQTDNGKEITITGKGNFDGTLTYKLKVIGKDQLKKFTVAFKAPDYTYTGMPQKFEPADGDVKDSTSGTNLEKGTEYAVVYQKDTTNAGAVKFTIVGLGYYTGSVTKSYTIKPKAVTSGMAITGVSSEAYPYISTGVTIPTAGVTYTYKDADGNDIQNVLEEGKDYKLTYSNNKKVGDAKIAVSFMGNYKGSKAETKTFKIAANALNNNTEGLEIVAADMVYNKPGVYKSVPYVSVNGAEVKASDYTVTYYMDYTDDVLSNEMGSKSKLTLSGEDTYKMVYMKITGKDKGNYKGTELIASYKVHKKASDSVLDLSKAKITVYKGWDVTADKTNKTNKMEYTGKKVEPGVMIELKQGKAKITLGPKDVKQLVDEGKLSVQYVNNVNMGKATIVVNGDGETYVGGKTATFSITTKNLKDTKILDKLFTTIAAECNVRYLIEKP